MTKQVKKVVKKVRTSPIKRAVVKPSRLLPIVSFMFAVARPIREFYVTVTNDGDAYYTALSRNVFVVGIKMQVIGLCVLLVVAAARAVCWMIGSVAQALCLSVALVSNTSKNAASMARRLDKANTANPRTAAEIVYITE